MTFSVSYLEIRRDFLCSYIAYNNISRSTSSIFRSKILCFCTDGLGSFLDSIVVLTVKIDVERIAVEEIDLGRFFSEKSCPFYTCIEILS